MTRLTLWIRCGRRTLARRVAGAWTVVVLALPASGAVISGTVRDADDGKPLPYPLLALRALGATDSSAADRGRQGDRSGAFQFADLPAGAWVLRCTYVGYQTRIDTVQADETTPLHLDLRLRPAPIAVDRVLVQADRLRREREAQTGVVRLTRDVLATIPSIGEPDPLRSLQLLPGVQAASDISSGLYIRGGGPDQTLILLDGVTVYNPTHAFGFFSTFNPDAVGEVTLYKGAYPAGYGGRLGAVVDVSSRTPRADSLVGTVSLSTIAARLALEGPAGKNRWSVSSRRTYLEPILSGLRKNTPEIPFYNFYDLNAQFTTERRAGWTEITLYRGRDNLRIEPDADTRLGIHWGNTLASVRYNRALSKTLLARASLSGSEYESLTDANFFNTPFDVTNRLRDLTTNASLRWQFSDAHSLDAGLQASAWDFRFQQSFNRDAPVGLRSKPVELALYADDQRSLQDARTSIRSGLRLRYVSDGDRFLVEPRLAIGHAVTDRVRVKAGGGLYNQYLQLIASEGFSAADVYVPIDATAAPGRSWQAVLGADWDPSDEWRFSAETYYTDLTHLVDFDNRVAADQESFTAADLFVTGGTGWASGLELFAERRVGPVTGWLGYTLGWSRRTFDELNGGAAFPPKYDRRHDFKAVASWKRGAWRYSGSLLVSTGQAYTPAAGRYRIEDPAIGPPTPGGLVLPGDRNSARLLPYHRMDFSATRDFRLFGRPANAFLQVFNLYSRRNEWFVQFDDEKPEVDVIRMLPVVPSLGIEFAF